MRAPSTFDSPRAFLDYLKRTLAMPMRRGAADSGFSDGIVRQAKHAGFDPGTLQVAGLDMAIDDLSKTILDRAPSELSRAVREHIAIGTLDIGSINARIVRSADNRFAVLIHRGLMLFLSKATKLIFAWGRPEHVTYCNRVGATPMTSDIARQLLFELLANTKQYGAPYGALLHLAPESNMARGWTLQVMEIFKWLIVKVSG